MVLAPEDLGFLAVTDDVLRSAGYEAHALVTGTADASSRHMHWARRHPRLSWAGLLTVLAVSTMFVRDAGMRPTSTVSGTAIGVALVLFAAVIFLALSHPGARHRRDARV